MDRNLFVTKLEVGKGKDAKDIYEIYDENAELIATVDIQGKIHFTPEYIEALKQIDVKLFETLNLDDAEFALPKELDKEDISLVPAELEEKKEEKTLKDVEDTLNTEDIRSYSEAKTDQKPLFDKITNKQELDSNVRVTQTETLADMIPEIREKGFVKIGIVHSDRINNSNGRFSFVGITQDGQMEKIDGLENIEGTTTGQKVTSINSRDGSIIEEEQVAGMVRINGRSIANNQEEFLSVKVGQYGILEVDYVRANIGANKENRYFSAPIETQNQRPTTREVKDFMDKTKNTSLLDEQKRANPEIEKDGETQLENIDNTALNDQLEIDDIIVLENGTQTSIRMEAMKAKVTPEEFLEKYESNSGKTPDEIIEAVHDEIEEEYIGSDERKR